MIFRERSWSIRGLIHICGTMGNCAFRDELRAHVIGITSLVPFRKIEVKFVIGQIVTRMRKDNFRSNTSFVSGFGKGRRGNRIKPKHDVSHACVKDDFHQLKDGDRIGQLLRNLFNLVFI